MITYIFFLKLSKYLNPCLKCSISVAYYLLNNNSPIYPSFDTYFPANQKRSYITIAAQKCVLKFLPSRVALGHASSLLSLL